MRTLIACAVLVATTSLIPLAFSSIEKSPDVPKASSAPVRRFVMDFGEKVRVERSIFKMSINGGEEILLDFDRTENIASKIAMFVPQGIRGKMKISWSVITVDGQNPKGTLNLVQE